MKKPRRGAAAVFAAVAFLALPAATALTGCSKGSDTRAAGAAQFPPGRPPTQEELQKALAHQQKLRPSAGPGAPAGGAKPAAPAPSAAAK